MRNLAWAAMALLIVLHQDVWAWTDADRWLGLPIGISYHVVLCLAATAVLAVLVRSAWPRDPFARERASDPALEAEHGDAEHSDAGPGR